MRIIRKMITFCLMLVMFTSSFYSGFQEQMVYAYDEKDGVVNANSVNVRKGAGTDYDSVTKLSKGDKVHVTGEASASNGAVWYQITFTKDGTDMEGYMHSTYIQLTTVCEEKRGYVTDDNVNVREGAGTDYDKVTQLSTGHELTITGESTTAEGVLWYRIVFTKDGTQMEGYMHSNYVRIAEVQSPDEPSEKPEDTTEDTDYETYLEQQGFPESYRKYLRTLHEENPLWVFVALPTGIEWENAVAAESKLGRNLVPAGSVMSQKSLKDGAIDWDTGTWIGFDTSSWVAASESVIRYYLDPRNFLHGENTMLQFESLKYEETQTKEGVEKILKGTHMEAGKTVINNEEIDFAQIFMDAGKEYGVSPYHLASRAKQETGTKGSNSSKEIKDAEYAEFNGYYNFFNIGASPSAEHEAMYNGLARARAEGWSSPELSILGGAKFVTEKYIARGQNTLYLQKFDVVDGGDGYYAHQYMTNLKAAAAEAVLMEKTYANMNETAITYIIPIYLNMPDTAAACPMDDGSPYSVLSDLSVSDVHLDKQFDEFTYEYCVPGELDSLYVNLNASAYAPGAVIDGTGVKELAVGVNTFPITCTGKDGSVRTYTITIVRKGDVGRPLGDVNNNKRLDSVDALQILRVAAQLEELTSEEQMYADVNKDGSVDTLDAYLIIRRITGAITQF